MESSGILQCFSGTTVWVANGGLDIPVPDPFLMTALHVILNTGGECYHSNRTFVYYAQTCPHLVRDLTPVTGELVEWLPLPTEPVSLLSGERQYVALFAPLLPPAIPDPLFPSQFLLHFYLITLKIPAGKQITPSYKHTISESWEKNLVLCILNDC